MKVSTLLSTLLATLAAHAVVAAEPPQAPSQPIDTITSPMQIENSVRHSPAPTFTEMTATLHDDGSVVMNCREQREQRDHRAPQQPMAKPR